MRGAVARGALAALLTALPLAGRGNTSFSSDYLLRGVSPQEDALGGGALTALGSPVAQWENPAALGMTGPAGFALSQELSPLGGTSDYLAGSMPINAAQTRWVGLEAYDHGESDTFRDTFGQVGASFTNLESLVGASFAASSGPWMVGMGMKALTETLANASALPGVMADLGLAYNGGPPLQMSAALRNLGSVPQWTGLSPYRPESLECSAREELLQGDPTAHAYQFVGFNDPNSLPLSGRTLATIDSSAGLQMGFGLGVDYALPIHWPAVVRLGYTSLGQNPGFPYGLAAGFGLGWSDLHLDYAFSDLGELGSSSRLSIQWTPRITLPWERSGVGAGKPWSLASPNASPTASRTAPPHTLTPTATPTSSSVVSPTATPTSSPVVSPTATPTSSPVVSPTATPTSSPAVSPTASPTMSPTVSPTASPTMSPTASPTHA